MVIFWILMIVAGFCCFIASLVKLFSDDQNLKGGGFCGLATLVCGGLGLWFTRPWWQPLWFHLFYKNLPFWIMTLALFVGALILYLVANSSKKKSVKKKSVNGWVFFGPALGCFFVLLLVLSILGSPITNCKIYQSLKPEVIAQLPETTEIRYLPMEIARAYGQNKIQESEITLGDTDPIIYEGGKLDWVAVRIPNGAFRTMTKQADGFALIRSDGSVKMISQPMKYGEGMIVEDNIIWQLRLKRYWVDIPEIYYVFGEKGEVVGVVPYIKYRMDFPVMVPYWGGVFLFHPDGTIEDLTPEEAQALPYMRGQRLFPEKLARIQVESWAYKYGIWNAWADHKDQTEIPTVEHSSNQMPYLLPTAEGPKWFVATEPQGKAFGIFKIFFVDAHDGKFQLMELTRESALTGPNRVWDYIRSALPDYKWGEITMLEPRPLVKDGILYWMVSLTSVSGDLSLSYGAVTETVLVSAQTNQIMSFRTEERLRAFLRGEVGIPEPTVPVGQTVEELVSQANYYFAEYQRLTGEGKLVEAAQALQKLQEVLKALTNLTQK